MRARYSELSVIRQQEYMIVAPLMLNGSLGSATSKFQWALRVAGKNNAVVCSDMQGPTEG